jgi:SAM-dependent methyltransferase
MGIDLHGLNLLLLAQKRGVDFSETLTLGRQSLLFGPEDLKRVFQRIGRPELVPRAQDIAQSGYGEDLLKEVFGARTVTSLDASSYENSTLIHDLNFPLETDRRFTAILDFGCLEHVFNFPVALDNLIRLCRPGGHLLHVLPGNNFCGHGFYQFSPELFFSLYAPDRGFSGTSVFLCELSQPAKWYRVASTIDLRKRVNVINFAETYALVLTQRGEQTKSLALHPPQQSDYLLVDWAGRAPAPKKSALREQAAGWMKSLGLWDWLKFLKFRLRSGRADLEEFDIDLFTRRGP